MIVGYTAMNTNRQTEKLGLELFLQHPESRDLSRGPASSDVEGKVLYPELDADGDHVHFEMVPMDGDSLLWLTIRRGTTPELASASLRKIANLIERHGMQLLDLGEGKEGSFSSKGELVSGPLRLEYDKNGDLVFPPQSLGQELKTRRLH
jgi:hypothetical protein